MIFRNSTSLKSGRTEASSYRTSTHTCVSSSQDMENFWKVSLIPDRLCITCVRLWECVYVHVRVCICVYVTKCVCVCAVGPNPKSAGQRAANNQRPPNLPTIIIRRRCNSNNLQRSNRLLSIWDTCGLLTWDAPSEHDKKMEKWGNPSTWECLAGRLI